MHYMFNRNKTVGEEGCRVTVALVCRIINEYFSNCPLSPTPSSSLFLPEEITVNSMSFPNFTCAFAYRYLYCAHNGLILYFKH